MQRRCTHIRSTLRDRIFLVVNGLLLTAFFILLIYPLLFVIIASFSGQATTMTLSLWPKNISWAGYEAVFEYDLIWVGYRNSLVYLVLGTVTSLVVTVSCAYPLSRSDYKGGSVIMALSVFTMYFSGGLIPTFLLYKNTYHLYNSYLALLLPGAISSWNLIVMRTSFRAIPQSLE